MPTDTKILFFVNKSQMKSVCTTKAIEYPIEDFDSATRFPRLHSENVAPVGQQEHWLVNIENRFQVSGERVGTS